jgi:hypothetical protein
MAGCKSSSALEAPVVGIPAGETEDEHVGEEFESGGAFAKGELDQELLSL